LIARRLAHLVAPAVARIVPFRVMRRLLQAWALGVASTKDPAAALRRLFVLYDELFRRIDVLAIAYDDGVHAKHRLTRYHDFFVERVHPGERVLDIGCGKGEMAYDLAARAGAEVTGIDINPFYLDFAEARFRHARVTFVKGDALEDLPGERFDVVVLSNVLEHIEHREDLLRAIIERTRPNRILLRVPMENRDWLVPLKRELGLAHFSDPTHFVEYDEQSFTDELRRGGLTITHLQVSWGEIWAEARPEALEAA
jgi:SAM-dependent methyltransferase